MIRKWKRRYQCWKNWRGYSSTKKLPAIMVLLGLRQDGLFNIMLCEQERREGL